MNFHCHMHDLFMDGQCLADLQGCQCLIVGKQAEGAGVGAGADAPDMEVGELGVAGSR